MKDVSLFYHFAIIVIISVCLFAAVIYIVVKNRKQKVSNKTLSSWANFWFISKTINLFEAELRYTSISLNNHFFVLVF